MAGPVVPATIFFDLGDTLVFSDAGGALHRFDDALGTLQVLKERGYRIGLMSNQPAGTTVAQIVTLLGNLRLARYIEPDLVTLSTEIPGNVGKPAQPIFDRALAKAGHGAASDRSIFVTETPGHVVAARGFGWRAILKRTAGACGPGDGECATSLAGLLGLLPPLANTAGSNLDLAPPARLVDGLWAVPIDITRTTATLQFDAATQTASGDATLEFRIGRNTGCPIFDLRQTPTGAWLDGVAVPVVDVAPHDFGGGADASLRVLNRVLDAGSAHVLRFTYGVGIPQSSMAGSYLPQVAWTPGPRLTFNFGFTDLGGGRYLEAFVPANLIFDQFELVLEVVLLNTAVAHVPITNGTVTALGFNHWRISFPARFTAHSPMLEVRALDTLQSAATNAVLPVSGTNVSVTVWKIAGSAVDAPAQAAAIAGFLAANETSTGTYIHGTGFTALVHQGGMEYEGATTSSGGSLRHETFHSWWGRGVKPASQPDAWFDEAWTVYNDHGATGVLPFNFADPVVELCPRNAWIRSTASASYTAGERLWKGIAAMVGAATLRSRMSDFYKERYPRPVTTEEIETFLVARTSETDCVDAFHRFVYGFGDPAPLPDVWLRDDPAHAGAENWPGRFWDSPDLWVRNRDDGGLAHQNPEFGQDNFVFARVRNRSATTTARHLVVTFNVKNFAGSQFAYPTDFLPAIAAAAAFDLGPDETRIVKARWPRSAVPPPGAHPCLLAAVIARFDHPVAGRHVWEQNNLAQKNLTIVDLAPNAWIVLPVVAMNLRPRISRTIELELVRPADLPVLTASVLVERRALPARIRATARAPEGVPAAAPTDAGERIRLDCGCAVGSAEDAANGADALARDAPLTSVAPERVAGAFPGALEVPFGGGERPRVPIVLRPSESLRVGLRVMVPPTAKRGTRFTVDLVQRDGGRIVGGVALTVNVT